MSATAAPSSEARPASRRYRGYAKRYENTLLRNLGDFTSFILEI